MDCLFSLPAECCTSCEAFDYCIEAGDEKNINEYVSLKLKNIEKGDDDSYGFEKSESVCPL